MRGLGRSRQGSKRRPRSERARRRLNPAIDGLESRNLLTAGIVEFPLPAPDLNPSDITGSIDGSMWFTLNNAGQLGRIDTDTYDITTYDLPASAAPIHFRGIITASDQNLWFDSSVTNGATSTNQFIGSINPQTHAIAIVPVPATTSRLSNIVADANDNVYFAECDSGVLVRYNLATQAFATFQVTSAPDTIDRIALMPSGTIAFSDPQGNQIGFYSVADQMVVAATPLLSGSNAVSLSSPGNGATCFTDQGTNSFGVLDPYFHTLTEYAVPTPNAGLGPVNVGGGELFFGEVAVNQFAFFDPITKTFHEYPIPTPNSGVGGVSGELGAGADVWFTEPGNDAVAMFSFNLPPIPVATATNVTALPDTITAGQTVTLTATVTAPAGSGTPFGVVDFVDTTTGTDLGTPSLSSAGTASVTTSAFGVGSHKIQATYAKRANFRASGGSTTVSVQAAPVPTVTHVTATPASSTVGQPVTFTAVVSGSGNTTPTGDVDFVDTTTGIDLGVQPLSGGSASVIVTTLGVGSHTIRASYAGNAGFNPSAGTASASVQSALSPTATQVTTTPQSSQLGQKVTITAIVAPTGATGTPTGSVDFVDTTTGIDLGTAALSEGRATMTTSALAIGAHAIHASYSGDSAFRASSGVGSASVEAAALIATHTTLSGQPAPGTAGTYTFRTEVVPVQGSGIPTGSVTFHVDGHAQAPALLTVINGTAWATLTAPLAAGSHAVDASYAGDTTYAGSASPSLSVQIQSPDPPVIPDGPHVVKLQRFGFHVRPTTLVLAFDQALDPATAQSPINYKITGPTGHAIAVRSVLYDPSTLTVTINPSERLNVHYAYQLTVQGVDAGGLVSAAGFRLDGAGSGHPGSNFTARIDRSLLVIDARKPNAGATRPFHRTKLVKRTYA